MCVFAPSVCTAVVLRTANCSVTSVEYEVQRLISVSKFKARVQLSQSSNRAVPNSQICNHGLCLSLSSKQHFRCFGATSLALTATFVSPLLGSSHVSHTCRSHPKYRFTSKYKSQNNPCLGYSDQLSYTGKDAPTFDAHIRAKHMRLTHRCKRYHPSSIC